MTLPAVTTDLIEVTETLNAPCRFLYKRESQQPSGSFKLRGMSELVAKFCEKSRADGKSIHVFSSSGGNAGLAAAYASKYHKVPCTVVLPKTAKQAAIDKLQELGARVIVHGAHWGEADAHLRQKVMLVSGPETENVYCHPFDDETLWVGHGAMIDEIVDQLGTLEIPAEKVKGIVCSCGGGSLFNGIVAGLERNPSLKKTPVLVIETNQTPTLKTSVDAGELITLSSINTLSTSLAAPFVAQQTLDNYHSHPTTVSLVDDLEAVDATVAYLDTFNEVIEPACGATVSVSMKRKDLLSCFGPLEKDDVVIFIICGGSTVSPETMQQYRELLS